MSALPRRVMRDFERNYIALVKAAGTTLTHEPQGGGSNQIKGHFFDVKHEDEAIVQSLGAEARVVRTLASPTVEQFDTVADPAGRKYTVHYVHDIWIGDAKVGQKLFVTG